MEISLYMVQLDFHEPNKDLCLCGAYILIETYDDEN